MANHEINEDQDALTRALRMIETGDPVHADVYNALFSVLINNDVFLEKLANKMIQQAMISHVTDCTNSDMVMGADQGPVFTKLIEKVKEQVDVLNTKTSKTDHTHDDRYYTEKEIDAKLKKNLLIPSRYATSGTITTYQFTPKVCDQGILVICRSELYIIKLGQSNNVFNMCECIQVSNHTSVMNATASLGDDKKTVILKCKLYENPVLIGCFSA